MRVLLPKRDVRAGSGPTPGGPPEAVSPDAEFKLEATASSLQTPALKKRRVPAILP
jgi:hypothetical protein